MYNKVWLIIYTILFVLVSNCVCFLNGNYWYLFLTSFIALILNIFIGSFDRKIPSRRLRLLNHGTGCLFVFYVNFVVSIIWHIVLGILTLEDKPSVFIISLIVTIVSQLVLFVNGILFVYFTSLQLGIKKRIKGILLGCIPFANLVFLVSIITCCKDEVFFETEKYYLDIARKQDHICATKYPILLVHGVFFRDFKYLNYWGRIPEELIENGATIYYGEHSSAASVEYSANEITKRIIDIVNSTGCGKVNIIAHSKGGLDVREALQKGALPYVASLTTINSPHRGCNFADYLLSKAPENVKNTVSSAYNAAAAKLGDKNPDFIAAVSDLTASFCGDFDQSHPVPEGLFCQSVGTVMKKSSGGQFPLNFSSKLVNYFDGENDGLVAFDSFKFGEKYTFLRPSYKRGISHGDVIDLNRENIKGFDVREFYVQLVADLKNRGL